MPLITDAPPMTGVLLAGGRGSRLGKPKARIMYRGELLTERIARLLLDLFGRVVVVSDYPDVVHRLPQVDVIPDQIPGIGPMGGLHAALVHIATEYGFVVACDMPRLRPSLIQSMARSAWGADVVVPRYGRLLEPLHAIYAKACLSAIERQVSIGDYRLRGIFDQMRTVFFELDASDPLLDAFTNVNTAEDVRKAYPTGE